MITFVFDPGGTTGFAALAESGDVLWTAALHFDRLPDWIGFISYLPNTECVIEKGPEWGHHSPITKRAEAVCREAFPEAYLVPPNRWKKHPASEPTEWGRTSMHLTQHERDAVRLGHWFQATGEIFRGKQDTTAADPDSP